MMISPRPLPPIIASLLPTKPEPVGEITMSDVYQGLGKVPRGSVKALRIVQILPKLTVVANSPNLGCAGEENPRAILGTVPVEADGSVRFQIPAHKAILFQALDDKGFAIQTMRTLTYLQPGEKISCVGCHESRTSAPPVNYSGAYKKDIVALQVGPKHGRPYGYVENIQPILDAKCISCHSPEGKTDKARSIDLTGNKNGAWNQSYTTLTKNPKWVPRFPARNGIQVTPVGGMNGALGSTLLAMLAQGHQKVTLTDEEMRRFAEWIDLNALFYGSTDPADIPLMLAGKPVAMPKIQ
jgi:mono/diheme cytochrome c family protein